MVKVSLKERFRGSLEIDNEAIGVVFDLLEGDENPITTSLVSIRYVEQKSVAVCRDTGLRTHLHVANETRPLLADPLLLESVLRARSVW